MVHKNFKYMLNYFNLLEKLDLTLKRATDVDLEELLLLYRKYTSSKPLPAKRYTSNAAYNDEGFLTIQTASD
eukprot:CAMPEP_0176342024 /NCGR_PEP_ID=MMETSP0126-20121128/2853_1 /TAXON_ID=141414 ORGANISM="Strombidinopsis acuminatum, Strain SPMC142" /NCGR_SAMPLE_ID=MMETSP0126 /ASSEMBLY_ACC=CAM_ASM_000229 /LENGTH=71 /DNA_ID=CAMNT_0017687205 /DNA_START=316 /DNA_END=531 /DNA_ORIENTATION=+